MPPIERMTVTMPAEMAAKVKRAVDLGLYASTSEVVRDALRIWTSRQNVERDELQGLKADIEKGLADLAAGRVKDFDIDAIAARGRQQLNRTRSA